ncbi:MAG TPA: acyltransferase [Syntrophorhabdaceae bacterium]|nr:acyltransferase [Syntrophorhabdaceae bacterium]HOL04744.1 acyltransferase [Syntrophorhabdaceae bacterium]
MQLARGIGILLVTFGHSIPLDDAYPSVFNFIYSFHMPLFFFLSGFFAHKIIKINSLSEWFESIRKNTFKFIVPYFIISLSFALIKYFIPHMVKRPILWHDIFYIITIYPLRNPALFLWFLYLIIIMRIITPLFSKINPLLFFIFLLIFQCFPVEWEVFGVSWLLNYLIYYFIGIQAARRKELFFDIMRKGWLTIIFLILFIASYTFLHYIKYPFLKFFTASSGTFFVISLCFSYKKILPKGILETLGSYSLQIYLLQYFFIFPLAHILKKIEINDEFIIMATFLAGLVFPFLITRYIFPKSKILSLSYGGIDRFNKIS